MKILKYIFYTIILLLLAAAVSIFFLSEKKPPLTSGNADIVAHKMLTALHKDKWDQVEYMRWTFLGMHTYHWDKKNNNVIVSWSDKEVYLDLDTQKGSILVNGKPEDDPKALKRAWSNWCNDSFWMFAPYKIFDEGTSRSLVEVDNAAHGLMVTYDSGGVTPGDSYLWLLDEDYIPTGYKMWVKILPLKGAYASWEDWKILSTGAKVATLHAAPIMNVTLTDVKDGNTWASIGRDAVDEGLFSK